METNEELIKEARAVSTNDVVANPRRYRGMIRRLADALEAATTEPEWEYRATTDSGSFVGESRTTAEYAVQALQDAVDDYPLVLDEVGFRVERRPRVAWLPVEGEGSDEA